MTRKEAAVLDETERRLDALKRRLDALIEQLNEINAELDRRGGFPPPAKPAPQPRERPKLRVVSARRAA